MSVKAKQELGVQISFSWRNSR